MLLTEEQQKGIVTGIVNGFEEADFSLSDRELLIIEATVFSTVETIKRMIELAKGREHD